MDPKQLEQLIESTLKKFGHFSREAVDLLMLTAAQESHCGRYLRQLGGGPALGIFQMEPRTLQDIMEHKKKLHSAIKRFATPGSLTANLHGNLLFQIVIARVHYLRVPKRIPIPGSDEGEYIEALARYWKKYWNTEKGAGTVPEAVKNYYTYVKRAVAGSQQR